MPVSAKRLAATASNYPRTKSKITNGREIEGCGAWARRFRDLLNMYVADLGGADVVSTAEYSICRMAATMKVELEIMDRRFALGGKGASAEDLDLYSRVGNSLRRQLEAVGLKRVARDITPTLDDIAREIEAERVEDVE
jgi:hypothetical protein